MISIMGLFPPFLGTKAGLYLHLRTERGWKTRMAIELPFAHRCEFLPGSEFLILIAATVSRHKENPADWSRPGEIYAIQLDQDTDKNRKSRLIDSRLPESWNGQGQDRWDGTVMRFRAGGHPVSVFQKRFLAPGAAFEKR
jgi:hypothetical protein